MVTKSYLKPTYLLTVVTVMTVVIVVTVVTVCDNSDFNESCEEKNGDKKICDEKKRMITILWYNLFCVDKNYNEKNSKSWKHKNLKNYSTQKL